MTSQVLMFGMVNCTVRYTMLLVEMPALKVSTTYFNNTKSRVMHLYSNIRLQLIQSITCLFCLFLRREQLQQSYNLLERK